MNTINSAIEDKIIQLLSEIPDPEIPVVNIIELGMLKGISTDEDGTIVVQLMPTYTACPATHQIKSDVEKKLKENNINSKVEIVYHPAWTTDRIHPEALEKLKKYGIAPPQGNVSIHQLLEKDYKIQCPRCNSFNTVLISPFGSTPCKALFQCKDCLETFDYFKCHL